MGDGTVVDTEKARGVFPEPVDQCDRGIWTLAHAAHATLYRSRKGRYYRVVDRPSSKLGSFAEWLSPEEAARFFEVCGMDMPDDLQEAAARIRE
jgi:hypothetical protein